MKLTKNCIYPWRYMQIHAGGLMQPCCTMHDADYGDFIIDYCICGIEDIFENPQLQDLKKGLLTGNLRKMCQECYVVSEDYITTEQLQHKVRDYLKGRGKYDPKKELWQQHAYSEMGLSLWNRCNLRCIYCNQSVMADRNPYYKMEFPETYLEKALNKCISEDIDTMFGTVEGEATIHPKWYSIYHKLHREHPEIKLLLTTNLSKEYSEKEIDLLAEHSVLNISCDSMDERIYSQLRKRGNLKLLIKNLEKILSHVKEQGMGPEIVLWCVMTQLNWKGITQLAEFAAEHDINLNLTNYEKRPNTLATQKEILEPVSVLSQEEQGELKKKIQESKKIMEKSKNSVLTMGGGICKKISSDKFIPYDGNPIYNAILEQVSKDKREYYLGIVYDDDNISYEGIIFKKRVEIKLKVLFLKRIVQREVYVYKKGKNAHKFEKRVYPDYRKTIELKDGFFEYNQEVQGDIECVLLEISYWE